MVGILLFHVLPLTLAGAFLWYLARAIPSGSFSLDLFLSLPIRLFILLVSAGATALLTFLYLLAQAGTGMGPPPPLALDILEFLTMAIVVLGLGIYILLGKRLLRAPMLAALIITASVYPVIRVVSLGLGFVVIAFAENDNNTPVR